MYFGELNLSYAAPLTTYKKIKKFRSKMEIEIWAKRKFQDTYQTLCSDLPEMGSVR